MNDKKKYKEALEKARKLYEQGTITESLCYVFPELKESEDEKIRKWIIRTLKSLNNSSIQIDGAYEMMLPAIAWLEKQGNNINCIYDKELSELLHIVICRYINDPDISYPERENVSKKIIPYVERLEKQGESYTKKDVDDAYLKGICDAKQELEKQGEHAKFRDSIQVGDKVTRNGDGVLVNLSQLNRVAKKDEKQIKNNMGISETTKQKLEDSLHKALEKETPESLNKFFDEQCEQKPDDNAEPKFHKGEWITIKE